VVEETKEGGERQKCPRELTENVDLNLLSKIPKLIERLRSWFPKIDDDLLGLYFVLCLCFQTNQTDETRELEASNQGVGGREGRTN